MRASTSRKRGKQGWRKVPGDPAKIGPLLRKCGVLAEDTDPVECWSHFDKQGRPRRVHARYEGGWRVTLVLRVDGTYSISQAIRFVSSKAADGS